MHALCTVFRLYNHNDNNNNASPFELKVLRSTGHIIRDRIFRESDPYNSH